MVFTVTVKAWVLNAKTRSQEVRKGNPAFTQEGFLLLRAEDDSLDTNHKLPGVTTQAAT